MRILAKRRRTTVEREIKQEKTTDKNKQSIDGHYNDFERRKRRKALVYCIRLDCLRSLYSGEIIGFVVTISTTLPEHEKDKTDICAVT